MIFNYPFPHADCCNPSRPHTSPFFITCLLPPSLLHILKCPHLSFPVFSLSCLTDLHLPKSLSNKNKIVWNWQGVSWQAVAYSFFVSQPFSFPLYSGVVSPSFVCIHPHATFLLCFQVVSSSRQRPSALSLCNQTFQCINVCSISM